MTQEKTAYQRKLADPRWQKRRLEILSRDNWKCSRCEAHTEELHVHHKWYKYGLEAWEYPDDCYITLCHNCHRKEEENKKVVAKIKQSIEQRIAHNEYMESGTFMLESNDYMNLNPREPRLIQVMAYAESRFEYIANYVGALEDWKGDLTVHWNSWPSDEQKKIFDDAWEMVHESRNNVFHHIPDYEPPSTDLPF